MGGFVEKFGFSELFAYVLSGAIALSSIAIWSPPPFEALLGKELAGKELLVAGMALVYACAFLGSLAMRAVAAWCYDQELFLTYQLCVGVARQP
ncbi:MAG: hypothetical protein HY235_03820 [Acidobacteria bacterium]|nr:hypothetical protein [Acidobacteriota bacterium]